MIFNVLKSWNDGLRIVIHLVGSHPTLHGPDIICLVSVWIEPHLSSNCNGAVIPCPRCLALASCLVPISEVSVELSFGT